MADQRFGHALNKQELDELGGVQEFYLSKPRYLQQVGEAEPRYVHAAPGQPVVVRLPAKIVRVNKAGEQTLVDQPEDAHLKRAKPMAPKSVNPPDLRRKPIHSHEAVKEKPVGDGEVAKAVKDYEKKAGKKGD